MSARADILAKIRAAQAGNGTATFAQHEAVTAHIRAHPLSPRPSLREDPITSFRERVLSLASTFDSVQAAMHLPEAVARYLRANELQPDAVCWPEFAALSWTANGLNVQARNARDGDLVGITGAFCAIAETGTLMLLSSPLTPATTSLLPETHIAVVHKSRIVRGMEEAWQLLRDEVGSLPRAVSFISGPSRTADIEQTVTLGAHGPYRVHVILVESEI